MSILILFAVTTLVVTGLLQSRAVLAFLHLPGSMFLRQIHTTAAYWVLLLASTHIGVHWQMILSKMRNMTGAGNRVLVVSRVFVLLIAAFGILSSFDRDIFAKLFKGFSFSYWDISRPTVLFFAEMSSIMTIYICAAYYALKAADRLSR